MAECSLIAGLACRKTWHLGIRREHAKNQLFFFLRASVGTKHTVPASEVSAKINVAVTDTMMQLMLGGTDEPFFSVAKTKPNVGMP